MRHIYLACPYSADDEELEEKRADLSTRVASTVSRVDGIAVYSPLTHSRPMEEKGGCPKTWDFWEEIDKSFIDLCDDLRYVKAPGWKESTGVQEEIEYAKSNNMSVKGLDPVKEGIQIIGVSGKKRSGKDHLAEKFLEQGFERYAFADNLKEGAKEMFDLTNEQVYGDKKSELDEFWDMTPREILQFLGTDALRKTFRNDIWIKSLERSLLRELPARVIIPDVRFPDEVEAIQKWGGIVVRIDASERLDNNDTHESETALDGYDEFDYTIDNNGNLDEYEDNVYDFMVECGAFESFSAYW